MVTSISGKIWHAKLMAARLAFKVGDYSAALRNLTAALDTVESNQIQLTEDQQKDFLYMESLVSEAVGEYGAAEEALNTALALSPQKPDSSEHAIFTRRLAGVYRLSGQYARAERMYREALSELQATGDGIQVGKALMGLGEVLHAQGDKTARSYLERALEVIESGAGKFSMLYGRCLLSLAGVLSRADKDLSRDYIERAITIVSCKAGPNHPLRTFALQNLLQLVQSSGDQRSEGDLIDEINKSQLYLKAHDI